jgi:hypothetical protein
MSIALLAVGAVVLATPDSAQAGGFRLNIGGFSIGNSSCDWDDDYYYRSTKRYYPYPRRYYGRRYYGRRYPRRRYFRRYPKVRNITPYYGHPPIYEVKPFPRHPRVIVTPRGSFPLRDRRCW